MISLKGRLQSKYKYEKFHVLYYIMHYVIIGYITYFVSNRLIENGFRFDFSNYEIAYLGLTLFFSLTTMKASTDYYNLNKIHKNTLDYYIGDLNPSKGSFLFNFIEKEENINQLLATILFIIFIFSVVTSIFCLIVGDYKLLGIIVYNIFLMILSCAIGGSDINYGKVPSEKLNAIEQVEDLSDENKKKFREEVLKKLNKNDVIYKSDLLGICLDLRKDRIEIKKKEENLQDYEAFRKESAEKGVV